MYQRRVSTVPWSLFNDIELPGVHHACNAIKLFASRGRSLTLHPRWVKPPSTPLPLSFSLSLSPRDPFHSSLFPLCCVKFDIELFFTVITLTSRRRRRDRCNAVPMVARGVCIFEILTRLQGCTRRTVFVVSLCRDFPSRLSSYRRVTAWRMKLAWNFCYSEEIIRFQEFDFAQGSIRLATK